jgi:hypothetical protein
LYKSEIENRIGVVSTEALPVVKGGARDTVADVIPVVRSVHAPRAEVPLARPRRVAQCEPLASIAEIDRKPERERVTGGQRWFGEFTNRRCDRLGCLRRIGEKPESLTTGVDIGTAQRRVAEKSAGRATVGICFELP